MKARGFAGKSNVIYAASKGAAIARKTTSEAHVPVSLNLARIGTWLSRTYGIAALRRGARASGQNAQSNCTRYLLHEFSNHGLTDGFSGILTRSETCPSYWVREHSEPNVQGVPYRCSMELMCERALSRRAFGKHLSDFANVQDWIAQSRVEIDPPRLLVLRAAWKMDNLGNKAAHIDVSAIEVVAAQLQMRVLVAWSL